MKYKKYKGSNKYHSSASPKVEKLLNYNVKEGFLTLQTWRIPWKSTRTPSEGGQIHSKGQHASHEDCRYRFGHVYKYLIYIDPDEYILPASPVVPYRYDELIVYINKQYGYQMEVMQFVQIHCCTNVSLVSSKLAKPYTQMRHNCTHPPTDLILGSGKAIVKPGSVEFMGVHGPVWLEAGTRKNVVSMAIANVHHYKARTNCNVIDEASKRFGELLLRNFKHVLNMLYI